MHELWRQSSSRVVSFQFRTGVSQDPRRYNAPRSADVAVVYQGDAPPTNRVITVHPRAQPGQFQTHRPSELSDHLDPMTYPLLFPDGQPGYHPQLTYDPEKSVEGQRTKVSTAELLGQTCIL